LRPRGPNLGPKEIGSLERVRGVSHGTFDDFETALFSMLDNISAGTADAPGVGALAA